MAKAKFIGVFASTRVPSVRTQPSGPAQKRYWFAWEDGWGRYCVQLLDGAYQPLDSPRVVTSGEFLNHFVLQPQILATPILQPDLGPPKKGEKDAEDEQPSILDKLDELDSLAQEEPSVLTIEDIEADEAEDRRSSPEILQNNAAAQLDIQLRSEFSNALEKWQRGEKASALKTFEKLHLREKGIVPAHKHMFTDFAVHLRKNSLSSLAISHYKKAVKLAPDDPHAHFNLGRIYYETGQIDNAEEQIRITLRLAPGLEYAERLMAHIKRQRPRVKK